MVNVLVIGATGYIGEALCHSLVSSGMHRVYGLACDSSKTTQLARQEVLPVLGSITEDTQLVRAIAVFHINIVVDLSTAIEDSRTLLRSLVSIGETHLAAGKALGVRTPKLGYVYTSGTWVHGSSHDPVNDLSPVGMPGAPTQPPELAAHRPGFEQEVLAATEALDTMVMRPALIYGRSSSIWSALFEPLFNAIATESPTASVAVDPESRPALVHVDDVASGLHAAVDKLPLISGTGVYPIFDIVTSRESMRDILMAAAREIGFKGKVVLAGAGGDPFAEAISVSGNLDSGRARQLLGWIPVRAGFVAGMDRFAGAWVAHKFGGNATGNLIKAYV